MKKAMCLAAAVLPALLFSAASGQGFQDELLDRLAGDWVMRGTIAGQEVTHDIRAEWVLEHNYIRFHEVSRERTESGTPEYEAMVFFSGNPKGDGYACLWLDSTGWEGLDAGAIGHAKPEKDRLAFVFELPDGGRIYNTFQYVRESDHWRCTIDLEDEEGRRPFARVKMHRENPGKMEEGRAR